MTTSPTIDERIDKLEERVAFQDQTIEELSTTITDQWKEIERLKHEVNTLTDQLREVEGSIDQSGAPEAPPPHY